MAEKLRDEGRPAQHSLKIIRNCSAALAPTVAQRLEAALGVRVIATYAMTEVLPICSNPVSSRRDLSSVGSPAGPEVFPIFFSFSFFPP